MNKDRTCSDKDTKQTQARSPDVLVKRNLAEQSKWLNDDTGRPLMGKAPNAADVVADEAADRSAGEEEVMSGWFDYRGYDLPDWGGHGEDPIPPETLALAEAIYNLLNSDRPDDAPGGDGSIGFEWRFGKDDILCLDVEGDYFMVYGRIGGKHYRTVVKPDPDAAFEKK